MKRNAVSEKAEADFPNPAAESRYTYRRSLRPRELAPALMVAVGAGLLAFYLARLALARTPLEVSEDSPSPSPRRLPR